MSEQKPKRIERLIDLWGVDAGTEIADLEKRIITLEGMVKFESSRAKANLLEASRAKEVLSWIAKAPSTYDASELRRQAAWFFDGEGVWND